MHQSLVSAVLAGLFFYANGYEHRYWIVMPGPTYVGVGRHFFDRYVREHVCTWTEIKRDPKRRVALHFCYQ